MNTKYPYYRKRKTSIIRNLWIYRRLVLLAVLIGLLGWFIWANNDPVTVHFPFAIGQVEGSLGWVVLGSVLSGAVVGALAITIVLTLRRGRREEEEVGLHGSAGHGDAPPKPHAHGRPDELETDLPPPGYASQTGEFSPSQRS